MRCSHVDNFAYTKITIDGPEYLLAHCLMCGKKFKMVQVKAVKKNKKVITMKSKE